MPNQVHGFDSDIQLILDQFFGVVDANFDANSGALDFSFNHVTSIISVSNSAGYIS